MGLVLAMGAAAVKAEGEAAKAAKVSGQVTKVEERVITVVGKTGEGDEVTTDLKTGEKTLFLIVSVVAGADGKVSLTMKSGTIADVKVGGNVSATMGDDGVAKQVVIGPLK